MGFTLSAVVPVAARDSELLVVTSVGMCAGGRSPQSCGFRRGGVLRRLLSPLVFFQRSSLRG